MEKEVLKQGEFSIKIVGTDVVLMLDTQGVDIAVKVEGEYFMDKLAVAIPGDLDDTVLGLLKGALKG